jgi:hypothetical protein
VIFLLTYDKAHQLLVDIREYSDSEATAAEALRRQLELKFRNDDGIEVVLLRSESGDTLRKTHSRYFLTTAQIAQALKADAVRSR